MRTFLFSSRWLALHLVAVALVAAFAALGWWQLDAYRTSEERHDVRVSEPVLLTDFIDPVATIDTPVDQPVTVEGRYLGGLVVPARVEDSVLGAYAVGTLDTGDGVLIVLRGWVPTGDAAAAAPSGRVALTGYMLPAESTAHATGGTLDPGEVGYLAPEAVEGTTGRDDFYDGFLLVSDEQPVPSATPVRIDVDEYSPIRNVGPWQNLSYWAQWWVFAGAVIIFWVSFVRTGIKRSYRASTQAPAPDDQPAPLPRPSAPR